MAASTTFTRNQHAVIARELEDRYGVRVIDLVPLGGELDANFKATLDDDEPFFVRISGGATDPRALDWQNAVLQQLDRSPVSVRVPRLLPQLDGSIMSSFDDGSDSEAVLRVTSWVPGETVADIGRTTSNFRHQLGALASEVISSLSALNEQSDDHHTHHWMMVRSGESLRATMGSVSGIERRQLLERALERFDAVAAEIPLLPKTVVHQDLHDFNLLAERSSGSEAHIVGIVDFNDAVYTARIAEIGVAAVYAALRQNAPFDSFCDVVEGFLAREVLNETETRLLFPLAVARLAVNASTWTARGKLGNTEYAEARMEATWPALEQLLDVAPDEAEERIHRLQNQRTRVG